MPRWGVQVTTRFKRDVHRLPPRIAAAVVEYVTAVLPENPSRMSKALTGGLEGLRSARRGDYRVILEIDERAHVIVLLRVAHRAHIYRPD
jgi:mRNA-degrading endonuclease RelE of RelBE toxin-antitoxin system